jgi:hypothetical protein
MARLMMKIQ